MRKTKELQESQAVDSGESRRSEEIVVLTRTDAAGNVRPLEVTTEREHRGKRKKRQRVSIWVTEKTNSDFLWGCNPENINKFEPKVSE